MQIVTLDFETYFDDRYSVVHGEKLTTEEYIRDDRFEAHGAAVTVGDSSWWLNPRQLKEQCEVWSAPGHEPVAMLCHHAHFDGLILSHHFDYRPDFWLDTLSMGRVLFDSDRSIKLEALASKFSLQPKSVPYQEMKGLHWHDMSPDLRQRVAAGGMHDCMLTRTIADYMMGSRKHPAVPYPFPSSELLTIDLTIRMFTEPCLVGDQDLLEQAWMNEDRERQDLFSRLGTTEQELRSDARFAELLELCGVEPDMKITPKQALKENPKPKYAFAKTDRFMQDLVASDDPDLALLGEARLRAHSSLYQTRAERYGNMSMRGPLCIYLAYAAAHTRRWGGGDATNFQNLPSPDEFRPQKGALRRAITAP